MTTIQMNIMRLKEHLDLMKRNYNYLRLRNAESELLALRNRIAECEETIATIEYAISDDCKLMQPLAF